MLHGEPTWGCEWRHLIGPLARHHRVDVLDLWDITLMVRDWGGPIGTGFALRSPLCPGKGVAPC